jgi:hypothetical protein
LCLKVRLLLAAEVVAERAVGEGAELAAEQLHAEAMFLRLRRCRDNRPTPALGAVVLAVEVHRRHLRQISRLIARFCWI